VFPVKGTGLFHEYRGTPERVIFRRSYLKANKVSKVKGQKKLNMRIIFKNVMVPFTKNYQN